MTDEILEILTRRGEQQNYAEQLLDSGGDYCPCDRHAHYYLSQIFHRLVIRGGLPQLVWYGNNPLTPKETLISHLPP